MRSHPGFNFRQKMLLLIMDVLLLAELVLAFRIGSRGEDFSQSFLTFYVPVSLPTFIIFIYLVRRNRTRSIEAGEVCSDEAEDEVPVT